MDYWKFLQQPVDWIETHLEENLSLHKIACKTRCSEYHFSRMFRRHCGLSVMEYTRRRRLVHAANDLYSDKRIIDITTAYGYQTASGFCRAFRRIFGMSASAYRAVIKRIQIS